jgi:hypothetical protein
LTKEEEEQEGGRGKKETTNLRVKATGVCAVDQARFSDGSHNSLEIIIHAGPLAGGRGWAQPLGKASGRGGRSAVVGHGLEARDMPHLHHWPQRSKPSPDALVAADAAIRTAAGGLLHREAAAQQQQQQQQQHKKFIRLRAKKKKTKNSRPPTTSCLDFPISPSLAPPT